MTYPVPPTGIRLFRNPYPRSPLSDAEYTQYMLTRGTDRDWAEQRAFERRIQRRTQRNRSGHVSASSLHAPGTGGPFYLLSGLHPPESRQLRPRRTEDYGPRLQYFPTREALLQSFFDEDDGNHECGNRVRRSSSGNRGDLDPYARVHPRPRTYTSSRPELRLGPATSLRPAANTRAAALVRGAASARAAPSSRHFEPSHQRQHQREHQPAPAVIPANNGNDSEWEEAPPANDPFWRTVTPLPPRPLPTPTQTQRPTAAQDDEWQVPPELYSMLDDLALDPGRPTPPTEDVQAGFRIDTWIDGVTPGPPASSVPQDFHTAHSRASSPTRSFFTARPHRPRNLPPTYEEISDEMAGNNIWRRGN